ncbi:MAG: FAD-linked oxidase C-terminal domain-containing protein [Candidatus Binatia bacterium]
MSTSIASPAALTKELAAIVGPDAIVDARASLTVYECDGYTIERAVPELVVLPRTTDEVARVVRAAWRAGVPFVPRGAGTGLSGGCLASPAPLVICTSRMRTIRSIDLENRRLIAEAGVVNAEVSRAVRAAGLQYAPDPSSQNACTIGGNVAENSGGPHTLKYGVTTNHLLGVELVLPDGDVVTLGGAVDDGLGYDLTGVVCGAEGTMGIVTAATLRLVPLPEAVTTMLAIFATVAAATTTVSAIIGAGIVPAALEMMDRTIVSAVEAAFHFGFPTDAGAVLIIEIDGDAAGLDASATRIEGLCREHGAASVRRAADEAERLALWKSRKRAFGAVGRLAPSYCTQDGVVPRTRLPEILARIEAAGTRHGLRIGNVFHAGDGNIHPIILYDERDPAQSARALSAGREILLACLELGGSVTGEHGIGVEKMHELGVAFGPDDLARMQQVRAVFDPEQRANPGKIFVTPGVCIEQRTPRRQAAL